MSAIIAGLALLTASTGFLVRFAIGSRDIVYWPEACPGTRWMLLVMGAGCAMRGFNLVRREGLIDAAGAFLVVLIAAYSVVMAMAQLKQRRIHTA